MVNMFSVFRFCRGMGEQNLEGTMEELGARLGTKLKLSEKERTSS